MNTYVRCSCQEEWLPTDEVEFVDIQENVYGEDVLAYLCSCCGEVHESVVISRGYSE